MSVSKEMCGMNKSALIILQCYDGCKFPLHFFILNSDLNTKA